MGRAYVTAIVLAGGMGSRMRLDTPKQYIEIQGKPLLYYSLKQFERSSVDDIILVVGKDEVEYCRNEIIRKYNIQKVKNVIQGGEERYLSVQNGLNAAEGADYVLIHDAARPCVSLDIIERSINQVLGNGACSVGVPVKDTIKVVDDNYMGIDTPPRDRLWQVQTPQSFRYKDLCEAYQKLMQSGDTDITDDTMIIERYLGKKTQLIMGDYMNIKVTTIEDLCLVENFLKKI